MTRSERFDTIVFASDVCTIGRFACRPSEPAFADTGPITGNLFVFPRTAVTIAHAGHAPEVADRNVVMLYNNGQRYRRGRLSDDGDVSDWFAVAPTVAVDAVADWEANACDRPDRPFRFRRSPSAPAMYLRQRELVAALASSGGRDGLGVEDHVVALLAEVVAAAYRARGARRARRTATVRRHRDAVEAVRAELARDFRSARSLADLAARVDCSPFHLARMFRRHTGCTVHAYREQLRLSHALGRLADSHADLTDVALDCGFSSHSHFGHAFRRAFGAPPSHVRRRVAGGRARS